jgi:(E)-4-hydroxy-3-methyl-but-2-enyl pyrophosphate reductase
METGSERLSAAGPPQGAKAPSGGSDPHAMGERGGEILLAEPRGFCAGVDRAIEIVERALAKFGRPIYVRHEIVHNTYVVNELKGKGAIFIEQLDDVPPGATLVFSAHGVSQAVQAEAAARGFRVFDATCPLVTKVHVEVAKLHKEGFEFIMIGHKGHPEVEGTMGQLESGIHLVEDVADVARIQPAQTQKLAVVTQTTLSVDDAADIAAAVKARFPHVREPKQQDICYATQNRQDAVKLMSPQVDIVIVVGSPTSSNSNRLREVARKLGTESYMVDSADELLPAWFEGKAARGPDGRCLGARHPGAAGDRAHQGAGRGVGAQDAGHRGDREISAAQRSAAGRTQRDPAGAPAVNRSEIESAYRRIGAGNKAFLRETPLWKLPGSALGVGCGEVWLKLEHLQVGGSFKARGMLNRLLANPMPASGVIVASGGNAGIATAAAARALGVACEVFVPEVSPEAKRARLRDLGATVVVTGASYAEAYEACVARQRQTGALMTHAYDQSEVVAGAGTLAREIEAQGGRAPDSVLVSVGGGGLIGGVAAWFERRARVVALEPEGAPTLFRAREAGQPVDVAVGGIAADSLGARRIGAIAWAVTQQHVKDALLLPDDAILAAQHWFWKAMKLAVEPAAALGLAALQTGAYQPRADETVALILCGANLDPAKLA